MRRGRAAALAAVVIAVAVLGGCGGATRGGTQSPAPPGLPAASLLAGRVHGSAGAPVTIYEFSDFQCPFCRRFAEETYPGLDSAYVAPGRVRWVFINNPKPSIHPNSPRAAQYGVCARRQGKFWALHDLLFAQQRRWAPLPSPDTALDALATQAGLDPGRLARCLADPATAAELAADSAFAATIPVEGVPSFVSGGRIVVLGAERPEVFRATLDSLLAARATH